MTILLVNDDGYQAPGINALEKVLAQHGHEIWVMAPSGNRSAQSHAMNIRGEIIITRFGENHFHCSGTPVDCILFALDADLFPHKPDLIISGINHGYNCSSDILYSGTCSAACQGAMKNIKSIALSSEADEEGDFGFENAAHWCADNLEKLLQLTDYLSYVNVNFPPHHTAKAVSGRLGNVIYPDSFICDSVDGERMIYHLEPTGEGRKMEDKRGSDFHACEGGDIAISVISVLPAIDEEKQALIKELF